MTGIFVSHMVDLCLTAKYEGELQSLHVAHESQTDSLKPQ